MIRMIRMAVSVRLLEGYKRLVFRLRLGPPTPFVKPLLARAAMPHSAIEQHAVKPR